MRELRNCIRRAVLTSQGSSLGAADLEKVLQPAGKAAAPGGGPEQDKGSLGARGKAGLEAAEREAIAEALGQTRGNILAAARSLKVDNKTLHVKLKKYGIRARDFEPGA